MWTTVLALAIAVNFDPTRIGFILVVLSRPRPILQLAAYLSGGILMSAAVAILVVFVVHHGLFSIPEIDGATVQLVVGVLALLLAAFLATNLSVGSLSRKAVPVGAADPEPTDDGPGSAAGTPGWLKRRSLGTSPWVSGVMGVSTALPSVEYMALLVVIAASSVSTWAKALTIGGYLLVANVVSAVPLVSYAVAPQQTQSTLASFQRWIRARRRRDFALVLAIAGCVLIAIGFAGR
ncbi:GAP family protein [Mycolicibacterium neworleansense]|uniref:Putative integral membrane protein n=1 Tax=Mycolicibacterium neworleansense TaxID=146018 RepID=A0A0H5S0K3_9MYCO|nr:GAP family protein [Mycolicibacterium neworleansense]MCV7360379.1 GAP family protein [Mycolicibacterium neworleansense]CRZ14549.1 putative integral membrane protein [Mycolicibacterium neworleansense]